MLSLEFWLPFLKYLKDSSLKCREKWVGIFPQGFNEVIHAHNLVGDRQP